MASIQSLGVGSGLLTSELVEDIIAAEREATDFRLEAKRAEYESRISAYGGIKSRLETLRSAAEALSRSDSLLTKSAQSSVEGAVQATASAEAAEGLHSVEVLSLARAHTLASVRYDDLDAVVGQGTLNFRFGTTTFDQAGAYDTFVENTGRSPASITIDETNNTLSGIRDAINDADMGVRASIINDGSGYVMVLTSERTGEAESMEIIATESGNPGLGALAFNSGAATAGVNMTQTVAADDALVNIDGVVVSRDSNRIEEVIPGVTLEVRSLNAGAPASISITQDTEAIETRMADFVQAFNDTKALTDELTDFDEESQTGALLMSDSTLRGIRNQMRRFLSGTVSNLTSGTIRSLVDVGLTTNQNNDFRLEFDAQTLRSVLTGAPKDVAALLADEGRASDTQVRFIGFQRRTQAGSYDLQIDQIPTQGVVQGQSVAGLSGPVTIDGGNNALSVAVDGVDSGPINLTQKSYADGAELAAELESRINASSALADAGVGVLVSYDADNQRFDIRSKTFGSDSRVDITGIDLNTLADLGLDVVSGENSRGLNVAGSINGVPGQGVGQFLSVPLGPAPATAGRLAGEEIPAFPVELTALNNQMVIEVDGVLSNTLTLTEGSYANGADLAAAIQDALEGDGALSAGEVGATVRFDVAGNRLVLESSSTGTQSTLAISSLADGLGAVLGLSLGAGRPGSNAGRQPDAAAGLQVQVLGGEAGSRGQITLVRGVMNQLNQFLDAALRLDGSVERKLDTLEDQLAEIDAEAVDFDRRMDTLEERLRFQFASADALISQLNSTSEFLDNQLAALPGYRREK